MDQKCCSIVVFPAADGIDHQSQSEEQGQRTLHNVVAEVVLGCSRTAVIALVTYSFAVTAWHARQQPWDLAFVFSAYAALSALLLCLRRAEQLTTASTVGEKRRLHATVWALSTVLSCGFAYRVSLLMPAVMAFLIWCMTSFVVLFGSYMLVLCEDQDQQHQSSVEEVEFVAASDRRPLIKKIRPSGGMV